MPTICLDCRYIGARPSGVGSLVEALVEHLPALAPEWQFRLLRHPSAGRALSVRSNVTEQLIAAPANGPGTMWWLPRLVDLAGVDLFHAPANILPRGLGMPSVVTVHDLMWLDDPALCNRGLRGQIERRFYAHGIGRALRHSAAIVVPSEATRQAILRRQPARDGAVHLAVPGVPAGFSPGPSDTGFLGLPAGGSYVLTVGQAAPYKNHAGAIRGFASALGDRPHWHHVIVQRQGRQSTALMELAASLGVAERVHIVAGIDQPRLVALYRGAAALLHPSLCEGFGLPVLEAMACGCPVVTSNVSAMPEVAGGAALLVDPADPASIAGALRRVVSEPELVNDMRRKGLARSGQLDRAGFARAHLQVYRQVLGLER